MKRWHFAGLFFGLVVIAGLAFTACDLGETSYTFENHTFYIIVVDAPDFSPSNFELAAYTGTESELLVQGIGAAPSVDKKEATTKKSGAKVGWIIKGKDETFSGNNVEFKQVGSTVKFTKNEGQGLADIKLVE